MSDPATPHNRRFEALGHMSGGVTHDLNNLLMIVLGNAEMIEDLARNDPASDPQRLVSLAQTLLAATERAALLTRKLGEFARRRSTVPAATALHPVLQGLSDLLRRSVGNRVAFVFDLAAEQDKVLIDALQLETALILLAVTARESALHAGRLSLSTRNVRVNSASSTEEDSPGWADRLALTFEYGGEGDGFEGALAFARDVARAAGGSLAVQSDPAERSFVTFLLPTVEATALGPAADLPTAGMRVLVVDTNAPTRSMVETQLRRLGCEPLPAASAEAALAALDGDDGIAVLITDIDLGPGPDGIVLAKDARARRPDLRVLLTTAAQVTSFGRPEPIAPVLAKPFTQRELAASLRELASGG